MTESLLQETLRLIDESGLPFAEITEGSGVKLAWLYKLVSGAYTDPGVNKIEALNIYLRRQARKSA